MGKDLSGKELGVGLSQRKSGIYCARFTNRFGQRRSIYAADLRLLKKKIQGRTSKRYLPAESERLVHPGLMV